MEQTSEKNETDERIGQKNGYEATEHRLRESKRNMR